MKLRRAMAVAAATAVIAPLTLLSAPVAFAEDAPPAGQTQNEGATTGGGDGSADGGVDDPATGGDGTTVPEDDTATDDTPDTDDETGTPDDTTGDPATDGQDDTAGGDTEEPAGDTQDPADDDTQNEGDDEEPGKDEEPVEEPGVDYPSCEEGELDEGIKTAVTGLNSKIVAGGAWDDFTLTVTNDTGKELDKLWVDLGVEYDTNDESLGEGLAEIQFKIEDRWTDEFQWDSSYTGSFAGFLTDVPEGASITADLRIRVSAKAPAGSSFAFTSAVYEGGDGICYFNGDTYEFTVLASGSTPPKDPKPADPTGEKPNPADKGNQPKPQGGAKPITGNLAETGADSALPMMGAAGAAAVVLGAGAVFVVRRKKAGAQA
jgi:LPXTG-motif cell wall-anchored protein